MDKDMMAKINEALKANGKRELSLDDLDKVVGGYYVPQTDEERKQLIELFYELTDSFGFDIAHGVFMETTGYTTYRAGVNGSTDRGKWELFKWLFHFA